MPLRGLPLSVTCPHTSLPQCVTAANLSTLVRADPITPVRDDLDVFADERDEKEEGISK